MRGISGGGVSGALPGHADFKMPMRYLSAEVKLTLEYLRMEGSNRGLSAGVTSTDMLDDWTDSGGHEAGLFCPCLPAAALHLQLLALLKPGPQMG